MIRIQNLEKSYGGQALFDKISFQMTSGERVGLVGRNGHGKSTLFRLILKEEDPDDGVIVMPRNYRVGHLAQHLKWTKPTLLEEACLGLPPGEEDLHYKAEMILFGLGFGEEDMQKPPASFSGGFQIRLNLAKLLVNEPNLLLLDEPTNYLDIISIRWLARFLKEWPHEVILISHDRDFMDDVCTHTAAIHRQKLKKVQGGTEKLYAQIEQEEEIYEKTRQGEDKQRKQIEQFVNRFRAQATKAAAVQSRIKMLEKMGKKDQLSDIQSLDFKFHYLPIQSKFLADIKNLSFGYDEQTSLIQNLNFSIQSKDRIAIIGKNGKGKSTLLNLIAGELKPNEGEITINPAVRMGYFGQTNINRLDPKLTVEEEIDSANHELGRTAVRTICGIMMFSGDSAEKKISVLSGGEKSRVMLGKIVAMPANLLLLDEPTNHLDMPSIEALLESIQEFEGTVVLVTHSEMILRAVATKLIVFQHGMVDIFNGTYDEFLEKVGWEEEGGKPSKSIAAAATTTSVPVSEVKESKEPNKKERAELIQERSKVLTPLKKEMELLEARIMELENELAQSNEMLADASKNNDIEAFVHLSKTTKDNQRKIDELFAQLEKITHDHDLKSKKYEELIGS